MSRLTSSDFFFRCALRLLIFQAVESFMLLQTLDQIACKGFLIEFQRAWNSKPQPLHQRNLKIKLETAMTTHTSVAPVPHAFVRDQANNKNIFSFPSQSSRCSKSAWRYQQELCVACVVSQRSKSLQCMILIWNIMIMRFVYSHYVYRPVYML